MTGVDCLLMGDVTYGACCVDDYTANMLGAKLLVHYGHSCLVPTSVASRVETIYVFVTIQFGLEACVDSVGSLVQDFDRNKNKRKGQIVMEEEEGEAKEKTVKVSLVSTIQFANSLAKIKQSLEGGGGGGSKRV